MKQLRDNELKTVEEEKEGLEEEKKELEEEIANLEEKNDELEDRVESKNLTIETLRKSLSQVESELKEERTYEEVLFTNSERLQGLGFYFGKDDAETRQSLSSESHSTIAKHVKNGLRQINVKFHFQSSYDNTINGLRIRSPKQGEDGSIWYLYITNSNGSSKFRAIAENIDPETGKVTSKTDEIYSSGENEQCVTTPFVGPAGYIRWNIQLFARLENAVSNLQSELKETKTFSTVSFSNSNSLKGLGFYFG
ncbi:Oidioi.mRNA.OKI2018_I69.chr2.g3948.t1.cds [Oikopleura dioica]|uniref:Oidioi.mRNA.OKI2018_I69.chr2.g3948.t1.cds n=1 Tax=Oikopleura dioica TaxID=34765 RepID=A0ABN7SZZ5_OIKDI|nr:Oidioi.mRNA.OKI2018_I69.chr2.g3948.t1.cds [Oikopleura dioica]